MPNFQQPTTPIEKPLYILPQKKSRLLIPKIITFLLLGAIFYFGTTLNLSLLKLTDKTQLFIKIISLTILTTLIIAGIIINFKKADQSYLFYHNHLQFGRRKILYSQITNTQPRQNIVDKIFKTYYIKISPKFIIHNIPRTLPIQDYLQKLINYSKRIKK